MRCRKKVGGHGYQVYYAVLPRYAVGRCVGLTDCRNGALATRTGGQGTCALDTGARRTHRPCPRGEGPWSALRLPRCFEFQSLLRCPGAQRPNRRWDTPAAVKEPTLPQYQLALVISACPKLLPASIDPTNISALTCTAHRLSPTTDRTDAISPRLPNISPDTEHELA